MAADVSVDSSTPDTFMSSIVWINPTDGGIFLLRQGQVYVKLPFRIRQPPWWIRINKHGKLIPCTFSQDPVPFIKSTKANRPSGPDQFWLHQSCLGAEHRFMAIYLECSRLRFQARTWRNTPWFIHLSWIPWLFITLHYENRPQSLTILLRSLVDEWQWR